MTTAVKNGNGAELSRAPSASPADSLAKELFKSLDNLARFSKMVHDSGLAPKGFNIPGIGVAIQMGSELGLPPMAALRSIAVINGRPGIFGDAAKGLCESSGLMIDYGQWYEVGGQKLVTSDGDPRTPTKSELAKDDCTCFVMSRRKGRDKFVTSFSVADAKHAKLWGKQGPWSDYPARMLMFRARGFNLRDNFPDVLGGNHMVEELGDYPSSDPAPAIGDRLAELKRRTAAQLPPAEDVSPDPEPDIVSPDAEPESDEAGPIPAAAGADE